MHMEQQMVKSEQEPSKVTKVKRNGPDSARLISLKFGEDGK